MANKSGNGIPWLFIIGLAVFLGMLFFGIETDWGNSIQ